MGSVAWYIPTLVWEVYPPWYMYTLYIPGYTPLYTMHTAGLWSTDEVLTLRREEALGSGPRIIRRDEAHRASQPPKV